MDPLIAAAEGENLTIAYANVFCDDLLIPGIEKEARRTELTRLIASVQADILPRVFGYGFYKALETGLAEDPVPDMWTELIGSFDWTDSTGKLTEYKGLKRFVACHVYCAWLTKNVSQTTGIGEFISKGEGEIVNPKHKLVKAWNEATDIANRMWHMLENRKDGDDYVYPTFYGYEADAKYFTKRTVLF